MDQNQITVTEAVLAACFSGKATPEEYAAVEKWRLLSSGNESAFRDYALIWERSGNFEPALQINKDAAFARILEKTGKQVVTSAERSPLYYFSRMAAVIVLLIISVILFRQKGTGEVFDQTTVATTENQELHLSDGSVVWLRKGSTLLYHSEDNGSAFRHVRLKGDGFFEVAHNPARPFRVELEDGACVEVLGTEFHVSQTGANIGVLVKSGKVRFSPTRGDFPVLTASQKAVYSKKDARLTISESSSMNEFSWHTGGLEFVSTPLSKVVEDLEQFYHAEITLENSALNSCLHTAPLTNAPLEEVLSALELAYGLRVIRTGNGYKLTGGNCGK